MKFDRTIEPDFIGKSFLFLEQSRKFDFIIKTPKQSRIIRKKKKFTNKIDTLFIFEGFKYIFYKKSVSFKKPKAKKSSEKPASPLNKQEKSAI